VLGSVFEKADPGRLSETFGLSVERLNGRTDVLNGTRVDAYLQYSEVQKGLKQIFKKTDFSSPPPTKKRGKF
jgi:hypothetical protein